MFSLKSNTVRASCTVYGCTSITLDQLITDFITGQIRPVKFWLTFVGDGIQLALRILRTIGNRLGKLTL